jgi:hypothetical protein
MQTTGQPVGHGALIALTLVATTLSLATLACNAPFVQGNSTASPAPTSTTAGTDAPPPQVVIEEPADGVQAWAGDILTVRVRATDSIGITRVEMRQSGRIVASQPLPDPDRDLTVLINYTPSGAGRTLLEIVAFRGIVASNIASLNIDFVANKADVKTPLPAGVTPEVVADAICSLRVNISGLAFRIGPGTNYRQITTLRAGEELGMIGRNASGSWYQARRSDGATGWVGAGYVSPKGDCRKAPITTPSAPPGG